MRRSQKERETEREEGRERLQEKENKGTREEQKKRKLEKRSRGPEGDREGKRKAGKREKERERYGMHTDLNKGRKQYLTFLPGMYMHIVYSHFNPFHPISISQHSRTLN